MKKIGLVLILLLCSCSAKSNYTKAEQEKLSAFGVLNIAENDCENPDSVKMMLEADFNENYINQYCSLKIEDANAVNELISHDLGVDEIQKYLEVEYLHANSVSRYINYQKTNKDKNISSIVLAVNLGEDLKPYEEITYIDNEDVDLLINKYYGLKDGYVPSDLVEIKYTCTQGKDYSCSTMDKQQLRKEAAIAYETFVEAAKKESIDIVSIASYRSYEYQNNLYSYYLGEHGREYADKYYARPGHSEHNTGLAVDISFNDHPFNEIEKYDGYDWIIENMHKYGFILRYPEDKTDITKYGYESWHLRYVGKEVASYLYENDLTLDEYHAMK